MPKRQRATPSHKPRRVGEKRPRALSCERSSPRPPGEGRVRALSSLIARRSLLTAYSPFRSVLDVKELRRVQGVGCDVGPFGVVGRRYVLSRPPDSASGRVDGACYQLLNPKSQIKNQKLDFPPLAGTNNHAPAFSRASCSSAGNFRHPDLSRFLSVSIAANWASVVGTGPGTVGHHAKHGRHGRGAWSMCRPTAHGVCLLHWSAATTERTNR
jgi:hypothetical protein